MSRVRSRGLLENAWVTMSDFNPDGSMSSQATSVGLSKSNGETQNTTDVVISNYKSRASSGEVFMNPFSVLKDRRKTPLVRMTFGPHEIWGSRVLDGMMACEWSVPPTRPSWFNSRILDAQQRTILQAHSNVAKEDFLALVTVAEAHKTASMLAKPFGSALSLIEKVAARKLALVKRGLTIIAASVQAWNEYRFGWKPLLYEIHGIHDAYVGGLTHNSKPKLTVARAGDRDIVWDSPSNVTSATHPGGVIATMVANYSHRAKVSSGVLYELHDDTLASATARRMGIRLSDVPSTIWELVPYSFVVDRFVDIGMWLNAIVPKPGVTIRGSWTTTIDYQLNFHSVKAASITVGPFPWAGLPASVLHSEGGTFTEEIQSVSRIVNPQVPLLPTINYRDLNLVQQIDHVALITQRLLNLKGRT